MDDDRGESDVGMLVVRLVIPAHTSWPPCDALVGVASVPARVVSEFGLVRTVDRRKTEPQG